MNSRVRSAQQNDTADLRATASYALRAVVQEDAVEWLFVQTNHPAIPESTLREANRSAHPFTTRRREGCSRQDISISLIEGAALALRRQKAAARNSLSD